jgi:hypothetical protein
MESPMHGGSQAMSRRSRIDKGAGAIEVSPTFGRKAHLRPSYSSRLSGNEDLLTGLNPAGPMMDAGNKKGGNKSAPAFMVECCESGIIRWRAWVPQVFLHGGLRAIRIVKELTGASDALAACELERHGWAVKETIQQLRQTD